MEQEESKIPMACQRCKYTWDYKGKNMYYVTCPRCFTKVKVPNKYRTPIAIEPKIPKASGGFKDMVQRIK